MWPVWPLLLCLGWMHVVPVAASEWQHAAVIDAHSTGSRLHLFTYYIQKDSSYAVVQLPEALHDTTPGLSSYAFDAKTGAKSLLPLIKFVKEQVPAEQWAATPIQLLATGLGSLKNETAEKLLAECRKVLAESGLQFQGGWARQLSGQLEGLYGFVSRNYASHALQALAPQSAAASKKEAPAQEPLKPTAPITGVLDVGGTALHLAFTPTSKIPDSQAVPLQLPGVSGQVFSRSFEGFGLEAAMARLEQSVAQSGTKGNPCLPKGYRSDAGQVGGSSYDQCLAKLRALLPKDKCTYSSCAIGNTFVPPISGAPLAIDGLSHIAHALGLSPGKAVAVKQLEASARSLCGRDWYSLRREVLKRSKSGSAHASKTCFTAVYLLVLLRDAFHLDAPKAPQLLLAGPVKTPNGVSVDVDWVLGALVAQVVEAGGKSLSEAGNEAAAAAAAPRHSAAAVSAALQGALHSSSQDTAALEAAVFCLVLIGLVAWLSVMGLGQLPASRASMAGGARRYRPLQTGDIEENGGMAVGASSSSAGQGLMGGSALRRQQV